MDQSEPVAIAPDIAGESTSITLFGGFQVAVGSRVIAPSAWRLRKASHLVKLLALAPQHRMHREQVIDLLWPHLDPDAAGNNLRVTLHFARKLLGPEQNGSRALQVAGEQFALFPDDQLTVDIERFEATAAVALESSHLSAHIAALDLYVGELLPEDRFEPWAIERREALHATRLALLRNMARLHEDAGAVDLAIAALREAFAGDPISEPVCVGLMRLYARTGRRAQALRQYQQLREVLQRDLDVEPEAGTTRIYESILTGTFDAGVIPNADMVPEPTVLLRSRPAHPQAGASQPRTNLPIQLTSFIGRTLERARLCEALANARLVTLTGPGGSGKTRLASEVAASLLDSYFDGVWLVELTSLTDAMLVPQAVASTLNIQQADDRPVAERLIDALTGKNLLLILDNCEHLIDATANLVDQLLRRCPDLRILATSREALRVPGEIVWPVAPLEIPDTERLPPIEVLAEVEAVKLFIERARLSAPDLQISAANAAAIASICERLDGLPLAIELAAARVRSLSVGQLAARLDQALPLLTSGSRPGPARHRSLQATITWSYDLLSEPEQRLLTRLAVFAGSFTVEAAEAICADEQVPAGRVLELLFQLVDKSLVTVDEYDGEVRYRLLETIRQFARELLERSDEQDRLQQTYRDWYRALVERAEPELLGPGNVPWMRRIWSEIDNIRVVLETSRRNDSLEDVLRVATALWPFWVQSTLLSEGRGWLEQLLAKPEIERVSEHLRTRALLGVAVISQRQGDFVQSTAWSEEALGRAESLGDALVSAFAYNNLCTCALMRNDYERSIAVCSESLSRSQELNFGVGIIASLGSIGEAELMRGNLAGCRQWLSQSLELAREIHFAPFISWMLVSLGEAARFDGDSDTARAHLLEGLETARTIREGSGIGRALRGLGRLALDAGDIDEAGRLLTEGLEALWALGYKAEIARSLEALASVAIARADLARAARLLAAASSLRDAIGCPIAPLDRDAFNAAWTTAHRALGEAEFARAWNDGQTLSLDQAVDEALACTSEPA